MHQHESKVPGLTLNPQQSVRWLTVSSQCSVSCQEAVNSAQLGPNCCVIDDETQATGRCSQYAAACELQRRWYSPHLVPSSSTTLLALWLCRCRTKAGVSGIHVTSPQASPVRLVAALLVAVAMLSCRVPSPHHLTTSAPRCLCRHQLSGTMVPARPAALQRTALLGAITWQRSAKVGQVAGS